MAPLKTTSISSLVPSTHTVMTFPKEEDNVPPLLTDGRFSGGSRGMLIAHLPDANIKDNITLLYHYLKK